MCLPIRNGGTVKQSNSNRSCAEGQHRLCRRTSNLGGARTTPHQWCSERLQARTRASHRSNSNCRQLVHRWHRWKCNRQVHVRHHFVLLRRLQHSLNRLGQPSCRVLPGRFWHSHLGHASHRRCWLLKSARSGVLEDQSKRQSALTDCPTRSTCPSPSITMAFMPKVTAPPWRASWR